MIKNLPLMFALVCLLGCVYPGVDQIAIQPEHLPIWVKANFHERFPLRTIEMAEQDVFQDKVQGYWCFFKDDGGALKKVLVAADGKAAPSIVVTKFPEVERADLLRITIGMPKIEVLKIVQEFGGQDITSGMQIMQIDAPTQTFFQMPTGIYWAFKSCNMVIAISGNERMESLSYWNWEDFHNGKERQARTERKVRALALELKTRLVSIHPIDSGE